MITNQNILLADPLSLGLMFYFLKGKILPGRIKLIIDCGPVASANRHHIDPDQGRIGHKDNVAVSTWAAPIFA